MFIKDIIFSNEFQEFFFMVVQFKRIGESKIIVVKVEVEVVKLMRQVVDILFFVFVMQICYLEVMQVMVKSVNSKVIFLFVVNQIMLSI